MNTLIFPIFSHGSQSWTIKSSDRQRIDAFETWYCYIPWTAHGTNVSILDEFRIIDQLSTICRRRILAYFGYISWPEYDNLERLSTQ